MSTPNELLARQKHAMEINQLCMRYGKVKTRLVQGLRGGAGKGICYAVVERWLQTGLFRDSEAPKKERREFRQQWGLTKPVPPQLVERQKEFADLWSGLQLNFIETIWGMQPFLIANYLKSYPKGGPSDPAYFYLRLDVAGSADSHAVGLKRGKLQEKGERYYSLLDANYYEVTHIHAVSLQRFLEDYKDLAWREYSNCDLHHVTGKGERPQGEQRVTEKIDFNKMMADLGGFIE